jgi:predicted transposase YdaD
VTVVCKAIEEMRNETARKTSLETAKSLLLIGKLTCEEIAQATKLTVEEVKELDGKKRA